MQYIEPKGQTGSNKRTPVAMSQLTLPNPGTTPSTMLRSASNPLLSNQNGTSETSMDFDASSDVHNAAYFTMKNWRKTQSQLVLRYFDILCSHIKPFVVWMYIEYLLNILKSNNLFINCL